MATERTFPNGVMMERTDVPCSVCEGLGDKTLGGYTPTLTTWDGSYWCAVHEWQGAIPAHEHVYTPFDVAAREYCGVCGTTRPRR